MKQRLTWETVRFFGRFGMSKLFFLFLLVVSWSGFTYAQMEFSKMILRWSPQGDRLLVSDLSKSQLFSWDLENNRGVFISDSLTAGRMATWSEDGRKVGFKLVQRDELGQMQQAVMLYEVESERGHQISPFASLVGNPCFSPKGKIAFMVGQELWVLDENLHLLKRVTCSQYINHLTFVAENRLVYAQDKGLWTYDWQREEERQISEETYFLPLFSPSGERILVQKLGGEHLVLDAKGQELFSLGQLDDATWRGENVVALRRLGNESEIAAKGSLVAFNEKGEEVILLKEQSIRVDAFALNLKSNKLILASGQEYYETTIEDRGSSLLPIHPPRLLKSSWSLGPIFDKNSSGQVKLSSREVVIGGVPYMHQIYSTHFRRAVSCGATSATMILAYYGKLKHWNFTSTRPFEHTSHYGNYVSKKYSHGKHVFDKFGSGSSEPTYGGHGYVWHPPVDTKGHMRDFLQFHGVASGVDWSPSWGELQNEVKKKNPFVILTGITQSGHYKTVVGYVSNQHTVILNDPYGNKTEGYGKFNGAGVKYDWPGYNNGYASLNKVYCYVYGRSTPPKFTAQATVDDPIVISGFPYRNENTTLTSLGSDVFDTYKGSSANEKGRELVYSIRIKKTGTLKVSVKCDGQADIDIHLLSKPSASSCLVRDHESFEHKVTPGTYYLVCDTFVSSAGTELMGDYTLDCSFKED